MFIFRYGVRRESGAQETKNSGRIFWKQFSAKAAAWAEEEEEEERLRKYEFELLKCENIMRFFHWIHFSAKTFFPSTSAACLCCFLQKYELHTHTHTHAHGKRKKNFHLFYSLTKLTSILFLPFYSNIIKAVRMEREEEKQFVTVYHSEQVVYVLDVWQWRKGRERDWGYTSINSAWNGFKII